MGISIWRAHGRRRPSVRTATVRTALGAAILLGALAFAGCGKVGGIPIDETAARIAAAVCPKAWSCCTADQLSGNSAAGTSEQDCETQTTAAYKGQLATLQDSVDRQRATYQSSKLDACLATIQSSDCATLNMTNHLVGVPGCASFTTPLVPVGGACSQPYECVAGWCDVPAGSTGGEGVCAAFVPAGQSCAAGAGPSCGPGAVCDPEGTPSDSTDDLCEAAAANGGACADDLQCQSGHCTADGGTSMTCAPPTTPPAATCFYASGCSAVGGRPGAGTVVLLIVFALVALGRERRASGNGG